MEDKTSFRYNWIDYAKGVGIFLMVFGHSGFPTPIQKMIWSFHMPLFFFISGMLFNREKYSTFSSLIKRIWKSLIIPYIFFSIINICGYIVINYTSGNALYAEWGGLRLLTNGLGGIALWFVSTLIITQFLFWLTCYVNKNSPTPIVVIGVILLILSYLAHINNIELPYKIENIGLSYVFYSIGFLSRNIVFESRPSLVISICLIFITLVGCQFFERFDICSNNFSSGIPNITLAFCGSIGTLFLCKSLESTNRYRLVKSLLSWGGKNTYAIMGLSQIVMLLLIEFFKLVNVQGPLGSVLRMFILWSILVSSTYILNKCFPTLVGKAKLPLY